MSRRLLPSVILLGVLLHLAAIARTVLPAQDGLKFLRVAAQFQTEPWDVVIQNSDQHPLYPAVVAMFEPLVASLMRPGPECWRISAQMVSMMASVLTLWPLYWISRRLFDATTARLTVFLWVLLPLPAEIGHDTLVDPLALLAAASALTRRGTGLCRPVGSICRGMRSGLGDRLPRKARGGGGAPGTFWQSRSAGYGEDGVGLGRRSRRRPHPSALSVVLVAGPGGAPGRDWG